MPDVLPLSGGKMRLEKRPKAERTSGIPGLFLLGTVRSDDPAEPSLARAEFEACFALPAQRVIKCEAVESEKLRQIMCRAAYRRS
jgi:hypothetical protein